MTTPLVLNWLTNQPIPINISFPVVNAVSDFAADPTGATDSTTAIQNAINSLPAGGGIVVLPSGTYKVSQTLTLGNGTASTQSTVNGIVLTGLSPNFGYDAQTQTTIEWVGASNGTIVYVGGPINGWGINNLVFIGTCSMGIEIVSASFGGINNVQVTGPTGQCISFFCQPAGGTGFKPNQFNIFNNVLLEPAVAVGAMGLLLDGDESNVSNPAGNTSLCQFNTVTIILPVSSDTMYALYLKACDSNVFINLNIGANTSVTQTGCVGIVFDYATLSGGWPANNTFYQLDNFVPYGTPYLNVNAIGATARPNRVFGISDTNSVLYPQLANTTYCPEFVPPIVARTNQSAGISYTTINPSTVPVYISPTCIYRANYYAATSNGGASGGSVVVVLNWTDGAGNNYNFNSATCSLASNNFVEGSVIMNVASNTSIGYGTTYGASGHYDLFITLEKLQ